MSVRLAMLLAVHLFLSGASASAGGRQAAFDADGARLARESGVQTFLDVTGEPVDAATASAAWRPVTDEQMRRECGGCAPRGYRFHRSVEVDLDHDGRADFVEMVADGREHGLRVTYGDDARPARLIMRSSQRRWSDQGVFAAGRHAFLVYHPEVNAFVVRQRAGRMFVSFIGD